MTDDPYVDAPFEDTRSHQEFRRVDALSSEEKSLGMWAHLGMTIGNALGLWGVLVPIILLVVKGSESTFVSRNCKEAINFAISMFLYTLASAVLCLVVIGIIPLIFFAIYSFVMPIVAGLKVQEGKHYEYPLILRLV